MSARIFISYRREDAAWPARTLCDRLGSHFGKNDVFMDVDAIAPGDDFAKTIDSNLKDCEVVIAIIGNTWLVAQDRTGQRLSNPDDLVRWELTAALERNITVIPVLVQGAIMPSARELPKSLAPLAQRNATTISESHLDSDIKVLIEFLEKTLSCRASNGLIVPNPYDTSQREPSIRERWRDALDDFWDSHRNEAGWTVILLAAAIAPFLPHAESLLLRGPKGLLFSDESSLELSIFAFLVLVPLSALLGKVCQLLNINLMQPHRVGQYLTVLILNFIFFISMFLFLLGHTFWFPGWLYATVAATGALMLDPY
jgi:hypothetical protein